MNRGFQLSPSILAADFTRLGDQVRDADRAGAERLHIDVMDGRFVPNLTMGAMVVEAVRRVTAMPLDVHLMIVEPDTLIPAFIKAGANRIYVHWEVCPNLHRTLSSIRAAGVQSGIAINPHTPAQFLSDILHLTDGVMVMTVNPGFGGQSFLPETLPKIAALKAMIADRPISIGVDGGINAQTGRQVIAAGADLLVVGSVVYNSTGSVADNLAALRGALEA